MEEFNVADSPADQTRSESICVSSSSGSQEDKEVLCSICMEAWTNGGEHQICCLPCGHLYGFSCINKCCHHVYAGLQNGMVLVFDMRQTRGPLVSLTGLTTNPVHSIHQLSANSTPTSDVLALLSASSMGLCQWNISGSEEGPSLVSDTRNSGFCIASSYCPRSNHVVATYRKKVEVSDDTVPTQTDVGNSKGVEGFHVCLKRRGDDNYQKLSSTQAFVDPICLQRTTFIDFGDERTQLFASCDKSTHELFLQEPSVFAVSQRLQLLRNHSP
ncbi:hypothetical protein V5N11_002724 [Cardamine amara subsp. amara]|uniref:RING-type domain-containing protein n=1 Tax=Cardamine amara subsp. amara TaxID=228776 RepID=A0ABD1AC38_CARAN